MLITERNYLKVLQGTEATLSQVLRFLQNSKKPVARRVFDIRNNIKDVIVTQMKQDRKEKFQKIRDVESKTIEEHQKRRQEQFQKRLRRSDD